MKKKALFNWSSGKDSALALYKTLQNPEIEIGEIVYRKYEKPKKEDLSGNACDTNASDAFDYGFWYCDLVEK